MPHDLLITFDLIRRLHAKFSEEFLKMFLVDDDLGRGQRLEFTVTVDILFDLINNLLNTAAHLLHSPFVLIFFLSSAATASGTNCDRSPPKAAISFTVVELRYEYSMLVVRNMVSTFGSSL